MHTGLHHGHEHADLEQIRKEIKLKEGKINLNEKTCPNREDRVGLAIRTYYGKASQLIQDAKEGKLEHIDRSFEQSGGCTFSFSAWRLCNVLDAVTIFHGPIGCAIQFTGYREKYRHIPLELGRPLNLNWRPMTTNLTEKEVIYGGAEKLKEAIREAERRHHPRSIFILASCASGIIGDDIEGAVASIQPQVKARLVPVHCEGFRSKVVQTGYDAIWHAILKYLVKKPEKKQADLVNIPDMFSFTWLDMLEIKRLLGRLGLRVNFIPELATTEQLEIMSEAALTVPLCPSFGDYLMKALEQEYGVPYFRFPVPIGVANTDGWLRKIAAFTGREKEAEKLIEEEHGQILHQMEAIKEEIRKWKENGNGNGERATVIGAIGQGRMLAQTPYYIDELGLDVVASLSLDYDTAVADEVEDLVNRIGDFTVLINTFQAAEISHLVRRFNPDFFATCPFKGGSWKREKPVGEIHGVRSDITRLYVGYKGAVSFASRMLSYTKNIAFQKTMLHETRDIYKKWYFSQPDPLFFVQFDEQEGHHHGD